MPDSPTDNRQIRQAWRDLRILIDNQASTDIKFILIGARLKLEMFAYERGLDLWSRA